MLWRKKQNNYCRSITGVLQARHKGSQLAVLPALEKDLHIVWSLHMSPLACQLCNPVTTVNNTTHFIRSCQDDPLRRPVQMLARALRTVKIPTIASQRIC